MPGEARPVWAEIKLKNLQHNFKQVKESVSQETLIMAIVKADGYGHGAVPVARAVCEAGADRLGVALPVEGKELREAGFELPIHILGEVLSEQIPLILKYNLIPTVAKKETAEEINYLAGEKSIIKKIHIKVDTGMGRIGLLPREAVGFIKDIHNLKNIEIEGLMTHFAKADESDKEYTYQQWEKFNYVLRKIEEEGIKIPIKQAANSAAIIDLPQMNLNMIRPGIILYGLPPSHKVDNIFSLKPVLSWKARIVYLKEVPGGYGISYGTTYITPEKRKIATIPLGYADGYPRLLSNRGEVLIHGERVPIRGRICMDQFMVDVTDVPDVRVGDEVVLIGRQGKKEITATELADLMGTINYEIVCRVGRRVRRVYKK